MLSYEDALNLNYHKKTSFTGWMGGMRFLLKRIASEEGDEYFMTYVWPGPYIFDVTPDEKKTSAKFPFTDEGKNQAVDWINQQYTSRMDEWPKEKIIL